MKRLLQGRLSVARWILLLTAISLGQNGTGFAIQETSTQGWNAAVNYWQAFGLMPDWTDEEMSLRDSLPEDFSEPLPIGIRELAERSGAALAALELANRIERCDWQLDYTKGPMLTLTHVQKGRELARQSDIRARFRFSQGDHSGAVSDTLAAFRLARAVGEDRILISLLVQMAIERGTINLAAAYLPQLSEGERNRLLAGWQKPEFTSSVPESLRMEKRVFGEWLQAEFERVSAGKGPDEPMGNFLTELWTGSGAEPDAEVKKMIGNLGVVSVASVRRAIDAYLADCDELIRIGGLGFAQRRIELANFEQELSGTTVDTEYPDRQLSRVLLPAVSRVADSEEAWIARRALFEVAVRGIGGGEPGINAAARELGIKVDYVATQSGFELSTPLTGGGKVEKLEFGGGYRLAR